MLGGSRGSEDEMCYEAKVMPENMFGIEGDVLQNRVRRDADAKAPIS